MAHLNNQGMHYYLYMPSVPAFTIGDGACEQVLRFIDEHGNDIQLVKPEEIKQFEKGLKWLPWNTSPEIRKYADWSWTYSDGTEKDF